MVTDKDAKGVIACVKDLPPLPTGERPDEVMEQAYEMYKDSKHNDEADYPEFAQVFEQKISEGKKYCNITDAQPEPKRSEAWVKTNSIIKGLQSALKYQQGAQADKTQILIKGLQSALKYQ